MPTPPRSRFTSADYLAESGAFIRAYLAAFGSERGREIIDGRNLPPGLAYHLRLALESQGESVTLIAFGGEYTRFTIHVELDAGAFDHELPSVKQYALQKGSQDGSLRGEVEKAVARAFSTSAENAQRLLADGTAASMTVQAANLSAAQRGAAEAVVALWEQLGWPTNPQPYPQAERDAAWLFRWWCLHESYLEIRGGYGPTVRAGIARAITCLAFDRRLRPKTAP